MIHKEFKHTNPFIISMSKDIIIFNVGSVEFIIHKNRLERVVPESLLYKLVTTEVRPEMDNKGNIFLDLNPDIFRYIHQYIMLDGNEVLCYQATDEVEKKGFNPGISYLKMISSIDQGGLNLGIPLAKMMTYLCIEVPILGDKKYEYRFLS